MTKPPLVSAILLCYNQPDYVAEAVNALLSQSYENLEIIIIDDCSTDQTAGVIQESLDTHWRGNEVKFLINGENLGGPSSCRRGLEICNGDFIIVPSGDDIMHETMISRMVDVWLTEQVYLVTANGEYIDHKSNSLNKFWKDPVTEADDSFETLARDGANALCFGPAMGVDRKVVDRFGWPPSYLGASDIMLPFYAHLLGGAKFIQEPLIKYRVHDNNASISVKLDRERYGGSDAEKLDRIYTLERAFMSHLFHALLMEDELNKFLRDDPNNWGKFSQIMPLVQIQICDFAKKLVRLRQSHGGLDFPIVDQQINVLF